MKHFIQYIIYFFETRIQKTWRLMVNHNAYRHGAEVANADLGNDDKQILLKQLKKYQKSRPVGPVKTICFAPTRSVYFGFSGKVVPCCFNRDFVYGEFPAQSLEEILNGEKRTQLQKNLDISNFTMGCEHCRRQIYAGNFDGVEARLYDRLKSKTKYPTEMIFELDNTCNLECVMCTPEFSSALQRVCGIDSHTHNIYNSGFIEQLKPYLKHLQVAKFLGGEPFLIKAYYDIWEELIRVNPDCFINLQTNGTVCNEKIESLLRRGRFQIGVSIDSLQPQRFEEIRKNARFETVMAHLDTFIKYTRKSGGFVNISVCPMLQNWEEIPDLVNFCNKKGVFVYFNTVYTQGFSLQDASFSLLADVLQKYRSARLTGMNYAARRNRRFFENLISQIELWYSVNHKNETYRIATHDFSREMLAAALLDKCGMNREKHTNTVLEAVQFLPETFLLSQYQLEELEALKGHDVAVTVESESIESLVRRLMHFLDCGSFHPDRPKSV